MFVENSIMYVVIVVFYGAEVKFTCPNTWNFIVYHFWDVFLRPQGTISAKNTPKMPIFTKKTFFGAYILIHLLNFSKT